MMNDTIANIGRSVVHHGPASDRAYLLKLADEPDVIAEKLEGLAEKKGYSKIVAKVPGDSRSEFEEAGFESEAKIPRFFDGDRDVHFMVKYLTDARRRSEESEKISKVLETARDRQPEEEDVPLDSRFEFFMPGPDDAEEMVELYKEVFASYPFPIHDPAYLRQTMEEDVVYFGIREEGRLVALSSGEMDPAAANAEMTDFATLPSCRGQGFATFLLRRMEEEMSRRGIVTAYTIARAVSFGMNITFARLGYRFGGTLTNNTQISGSLESMNIWYKHLPRQAAGDSKMAS